MTSSLRAGAAVAGALLLAAFLAVSITFEARAQETPLEVTFSNLQDGDVLGASPFVIQMCFSRPINIKDLDKGGDFKFSLTTPSNVGIGLRIVFQPDGWGYSIYPGNPPEGIDPSPQRDNWLFTWRVLAADDGAVSEGETAFTVDEDAEPGPSETPPVCLPGGGTGTPVPDFGATPTPTGGPDGTPTEEPSEEPSPGATEEPVGGEDDDDEGNQDIGPLAFGTIGIAAALALFGLVMYFVRKKAGYDPHAPEPGSEEGGGEEHH